MESSLLPLSEVTRDESESGGVSSMSVGRQWFGKDVGRVVGAGDSCKFDETVVEALVHGVSTNPGVL